jgi:hypothetical protein
MFDRDELQETDLNPDKLARAIERALIGWWVVMRGRNYFWYDGLKMCQITPRETIMSNIYCEKCGMPDWLAGALELADRRDHLCRNSPHCPKCRTQQVQLTRYNGSPAAWKCRYCKARFTYEPQAS